MQGHSDPVILSPSTLFVFCMTVGDLTVCDLTMGDLIPVTPVVIIVCVKQWRHTLIHQF